MPTRLEQHDNEEAVKIVAEIVCKPHENIKDLEDRIRKNTAWQDEPQKLVMNWREDIIKAAVFVGLVLLIGIGMVLL